MYHHFNIAVVIPAQNEAGNIAAVISDLKVLTSDSGQQLIDDIVVCDNGSTDGTADIAWRAGARVIQESVSGYGRACQRAISILKKPDIVVFVDADQSVKVSEITNLLAHFYNGSPVGGLNPEAAELVIGSRTLGKVEQGALSFPQRFGNWLASRLISQLWHHYTTDLGPFRAICYAQLEELDMQDQSYGWTVEMQIKAIQQKLNIIEVPVSCRRRKAGRSKISGTVSGVIGAARGILGTVFTLWFQQKLQPTVIPVSKGH